MKVLFVRELRRLLPYGLAAVVCLPVTYGLDMLSPRWWPSNLPPAVFLGLLPALLGVAAVAPDTASGGTAFLSRLPIAPGRVLSTKVLAAGLWLFGALLPYLLLVAVSSAYMQFAQSLGSVVLEALAISSFGFGSGLVASVVAHRTLPALLVAPCLALLTFFAAVVLPAGALEMGVFSEPALTLAAFLPTVLVCYSAVFVGLAFGAYVRGDRHRTSARPAIIATSGLLSVLLVGFGTTAAAHAWTASAVVPALKVRPGVVATGDTLAVPLGGITWSGREHRVALIDRESGETWVVPQRAVFRPEFSPGGRRLLLRDTRDGGGSLIDLETRETRELSKWHTTRDRSGFRKAEPGWGVALWSDEGVVFVKVEGVVLQVHVPDEDDGQDFALRLPGTFRLLATRSSKILLWNQAGVHSLALPAQLHGRARLEPQLLLAIETGTFADLVVSPSGRYVLGRSGREGVDPEVREIATGRRIPLSAFAAIRAPEASRRASERAKASALDDAERDVASFTATAFGAYVYGFSPEETHLVVERWGGALALVNLETGSVRLYEPTISSRPSSGVTWSKDGERCALQSGLVLETDTGKLTTTDPVAAFVGERAILTDHPLPAWASKGGAQ